MSMWKISPDGVSGILTAVEPDYTSLQSALSEESLTAAYGGLEWGGGTTACVATSLTHLFDDQKANVSTIMNSIGAGCLGVRNATIAYNRGQEDMCGNFQREALNAAADGDFTYFDQHGYTE